MRLRELVAGDHARVLELNLASERDLSPLDHERLAWIVSMAHQCVVVEHDSEVVAFALALAPGEEYDSRNYRWFNGRLERFLYLDRVVVAAGARRHGVATRIYQELEPLASAFGQMVCDVNLEPPNEASLAFHAARGYAEIGRLMHPGGHVAAMLSKDLPLSA